MFRILVYQYFKRVHLAQSRLITTTTTIIIKKNKDIKERHRAGKEVECVDINKQKPATFFFFFSHIKLGVLYNIAM